VKRHHSEKKKHGLTGKHFKKLLAQKEKRIKIARLRYELKLLLEIMQSILVENIFTFHQCRGNTWCTIVSTLPLPTYLKRIISSFPTMPLYWCIIHVPTSSYRIYRASLLPGPLSVGFLLTYCTFSDSKFNVYAPNTGIGFISAGRVI